MTSDPPLIAIIGGGLGALGLAVALKERSVPYIIYEANPSFTEIGAGINLNQSTYNALNLIRPGLGDAVLKISTRNPPGMEEVWLSAYFSAGSRDGEHIMDLHCPPVGNMTCHRNEVLSLLHSAAEPVSVAFNKKLTYLTQYLTYVDLHFSDGTSAKSGIVIGADGIHSTVRPTLISQDSPAAKPNFTHTGVYRAMQPTEAVLPIMGAQRGRTGQILLGPNGYVIYYPINHGSNINMGFWQRIPSEWTEKSWIVPNRKAEAVEAYSSWGPTAQKLLSLAPEDMAFWATHHHGIPLGKYYDGRVVVMGDAAHSMTPHQGAGAGQAIEDAYVLGEVLAHLYSENTSDASSPLSQVQIETALKAYSDVRRPRAQKVLETSHTGFDRWADLYNPDMTDNDVEEFRQWMLGNFGWIWHADMKGEADRAKASMTRKDQSKVTGDVVVNGSIHGSRKEQQRN